MQSNVAIKYYISACTYTLLKLFGLPVIMSRRRVPPTQTQIKEQVAQRVSARLKNKHTQHIIPDQSSPLECGIASQREHDLTKISKLSVPEKSMKPISTPSVTAPPIISIHILLLTLVKYCNVITHIMLIGERRGKMSESVR